MNKNLPTLINQAILATILILCETSLSMDSRLTPETVREHQAAQEPITGAARAGAGASVPSPQAAGTAVSTAGTTQALQPAIGWARLGHPGVAKAILTGELPSDDTAQKILHDAMATAAAAATGAAAAGAGATVAVRDISNSPAYNVVAEGTAAQILRGPVGWIALGSNSEVARLASLLRQNQK